MKYWLAAAVTLFALSVVTSFVESRYAPAPCVRTYHPQREAPPPWPVGAWESLDGVWLTEFHPGGLYRETKLTGTYGGHTIEGTWQTRPPSDDCRLPDEAVGEGVCIDCLDRRTWARRYIYRNDHGLLRWDSLPYRRVR